MGAEKPSIDSIFLAAIEKPTDQQRSDYLDEACGNDSKLRERVERLLQAQSKAGSFLESPAPELDPTAVRPVTEKPGTRIGPYKLMEQIGEGGMGVVFVAQQEQPLRRKVALKIVKPGMDTREVIARFEAERHALALMDHPNIAKVLDAGATQSGRPYFVMELVRGITITEYCDKNKLIVRARLELFAQVCQAIQHAHQKGIIHRDVKPTNVLVTLHDGKPVPKVIDFGVAKATNQRLTQQTIYTRFAQIIGTPAYMSPEQAEMSGLDIDTRSDIYSLGVLLYELLTGSTPFDKTRMQEVALDEMRRIVCEEEPPRPSTKISTLGESATVISTHRGTDARGLTRFVMGDLDVIVMKAIEKDRTRRYDTAVGLADDVHRFLEDEPIVARAPSLTYRFTKFTRRNRVAMATSALVLVSLVLGIAGMSLGLEKSHSSIDKLHTANKKLDDKNAELDEKNKRLTSLATSYRAELFERALTEAMRASPEATQLISEAKDAGVVAWKLEMLRGQFALYSGDPEEAVGHLESAVRLATDSGTTCMAAESMLTIAYFHAGRLKDFLNQSSKVQAHALKLSKPIEPYDYMFMAQGSIVFPRAALKVLGQGYPMDHAQTALSLAVRAELLAWNGVSYSDPIAPHRAMEYAHATRLLLGDTPYALQVDLLAHASAIAVARDKEGDWDAYHTEAKLIASKLREKYPKYAWGSQVRAWHCIAAGDHAGAEQALLDAVKFSDSPIYKTSLAIARYQTDAADMVRTARETIRDMNSLWYATIIVQCLTDTPDGRDMARATRREVLAAAASVPELFESAARISMALGEPERAKTEAQSALQSGRRAKVPNVGYAAWIHHRQRFLAGAIDSQQLLHEAHSNRHLKGEGYLLIARQQLANRDFENARDSLDLAVENGFPWLYSSQIADGLRKRLKDPHRFDWLKDVAPGS